MRRKRNFEMVGLFDKKSRRASIYLCISRGSPHCCQSAFWRERVVAQAGEQRPPMVSRNPDLIDRVRVSLSPTILACPRIQQPWFASASSKDSKTATPPALDLSMTGSGWITSGLVGLTPQCALRCCSVHRGAPGDGCTGRGAVVRLPGFVRCG